MGRTDELGKQPDWAVEPPPANADASFVLGTSVIVERFFSLCKLVLNDRRASLTPWMFECIMFLKVSKDYWTIEDTAMALKRYERKEIDGREQRDFGGHQEAALNEEM